MVVAATCGIGREAVRSPLSPVAEVTDSVLFEDPSDPSRKYYLPRYGLGEDNVSGQARYRASLEKDGEGWRLVFHLVRYPAPELQDQASQASELPHDVSIILRYLVAGSEASPREAFFGEIISEGGGIMASLKIATLAERDEIYRALTEPSYRSSLLARRKALVAVPSGSAGLYSEVSKALDQAVNPVPFQFPQNLHGYIYRDISSGSEPGLVRRQVDGRVYYQDSSEPHIFYYLPDCFKIMRNVDFPHTPRISVGFPTEDQVSLTYYAAPYLDQTRILADTEKLRVFVPALPQGVKSPNLQRLQQADSSKIKLLLSMKSRAKESGSRGKPAGPDSSLQEREGVLNSLWYEFVDNMMLGTDDFQEIFNALMGEVTTMFQGRVEVEVFEGQSESVPFVASIKDLLGAILDIIDCSGQKAETLMGIKAGLKNGIECPVKINSLKVAVVKGTSRIEGVIPHLSLPLVIKAGEEIKFTIEPKGRIPGSTPPRLVFDFSGLEVVPDKVALWNSIVDGSVPSTPKRIRVKTFAFSSQPKDLQEILVEFKTGEVVELTLDKTCADVELRLPLRERILGNIDPGTYSYSLKVVKSSGEVAQTADRTCNVDILVVS